MTCAPLIEKPALDHLLDGLLGDVLAHAVVDAPAGQDHLRVIAERLGLVRQVVRVDADAVAADQAGAKRQEVPLRAGRLQHLERVDADAVEDQRQLVHQRDVEVALRVLDHLGRLGHLDARGLVHAGGDDAAVDLGHLLQRRRRVARHHLHDPGQRVLLVAGVDALGRVADEEVLLPLQARVLLEQRDADLLGGAGIHGRLVDHDGAALEVACRPRCSRRPAERSRGCAPRRPASAPRRR